MGLNRFADMQYYYTAYIDGIIAEENYSYSMPKVRERLRYLVRKHNKPVVYQVKKLAHRKQGTERRSWETGVLDTNLRWHKTTTYHNYKRKRPSLTPQDIK